MYSTFDNKEPFVTFLNRAARNQRTEPSGGPGRGTDNRVLVLEPQGHIDEGCHKSTLKLQTLICFQMIFYSLETRCRQNNRDQLLTL